MVDCELTVAEVDEDEELSDAIAPMLQLPSEDLTRLLLTLSREELLEQFGGQSS